MADSFSTNTNNSNTYKKPRRTYKPKKFKAPTVKKSPEQVKQEKISKLRTQIADLRREKAELRTIAQQQQKDLQSVEFRAKLNSIDDKITQKMQRMRDIATNVRDTVSNVARKVGDVAGAPVSVAKRVWDNWEI